MYSIAIETSSTKGGVCFYNNNTHQVDFKTLWQREKPLSKSSPRSKSHSEFFSEAIDSGLRDLEISIDQVDCYITSIGPGSFTGIRVGINAVKALCYVQNKPYLALNSLLVLAINGKQQPLPVLTIVNAFKKQVYTALYQFEGNKYKQVIAPCSLTIPELEKSISSPVLCLGDGYDTYFDMFSNAFSENLKRDSSLSDYPEVQQLAQHSHLFTRPEKDWKSLNPLYIRASEAEEKLRSGLLKPIPGL